MSVWLGMSRQTGQRLNSVEHVHQSLADIFTTSIGSRLMRREYGSLLPALIDQPINPATCMRLINGAITATLRWEPRLKIVRCYLGRAD